MCLSTHTRSLYGSNRIPSGRPSTSMVLITFKVFASHIVIGFVVENPWCVLGSTVAPPALNSRRRMLDLAQDFENVPEKIQQADKLLRQVGVYCNFVPNVSALTDYVRLLKTASSFFQASSKRNSERNRHLVFVELYVRHKTRKTHYPELAAIVSGIRLWCGLSRDVDVDADAIRGKVNRFAISGMMGEVSEPSESGESTTDEDIK